MNLLDLEDPFVQGDSAKRFATVFDREESDDGQHLCELMYPTAPALRWIHLLTSSLFQRHLHPLYPEQESKPAELG